MARHGQPLLQVTPESTTADPRRTKEAATVAKTVERDFMTTRLIYEVDTSDVNMISENWLKKSRKSCAENLAVYEQTGRRRRNFSETMVVSKYEWGPNVLYRSTVILGVKCNSVHILIDSQMVISRVFFIVSNELLGWCDSTQSRFIKRNLFSMRKLLVHLLLSKSTGFVTVAH